MSEEGKAVEKFDFVTAIATEFWHVQRMYSTSAKAVYLRRHEMQELVDQAKQVEAVTEPERIAAFDEWNAACEAHEAERVAQINRELPAWLQAW